MTDNNTKDGDTQTQNILSSSCWSRSFKCMELYEFVISPDQRVYSLGYVLSIVKECVINKPKRGGV